MKAIDNIENYQSMSAAVCALGVEGFVSAVLRAQLEPATPPELGSLTSVRPVEWEHVEWESPRSTICAGGVAESRSCGTPHWS